MFICSLQRVGGGVYIILMQQVLAEQLKLWTHKKNPQSLNKI